MSKPSAWLTQIQRQHQQELQETAILIREWAEQAMTDAVFIALFHGTAVDGKPLGFERAKRIAKEIFRVYHDQVATGITSAPDADVFRAQVDKLLRAKMPEEIFVPWEERYRNWESLTVEEEAARYGAVWRKEGRPKCIK